MSKLFKNLDKILRYLYQNRNSYPDFKEISTKLGIRNDPKYRAHLERDNYIENVGKTKDGDGFRISKIGEFFLDIEGGYSSQSKSNSPFNNSKKQRIIKFLDNKWTFTIITGIIVVVVGGLILLLIGNPFDDTKKIAKANISEVRFIPNNYKIKMDNINYPILDTISIDIIFKGISATINRNFKLVSYKFENDQYFIKMPEYPSQPELELVEVFIRNPIIDTNNPKVTALVQIRRKSVFDGIEVANFRTNDKLKIGYLKIAVDFESLSKIKSDTINFDIYLEK